MSLTPRRNPILMSSRQLFLGKEMLVRPSCRGCEEVGPFADGDPPFPSDAPSTFLGGSLHLCNLWSPFQPLLPCQLYSRGSRGQAPLWSEPLYVWAEIMSAFTSCMQSVQCGSLGLWWLQLPNGFLMRQSHSLAADEGCAPALPCPPDAGRWRAASAPSLFRIDHSPSALYPLA